MKKTFVYVRVSSAEQKDNGVSIDRQIEMALAYCTANGLFEPIVLRDEACSGFKESRKAFQELLASCQSGEAGTVIIYDLSRLSRNLKTTLDFVDLVSKHEISFVSLTEKIDTSSAYGKFILHIFASIHQLYRDSVSDKMKVTWEHKRQKSEKLGGKIPYGFNVKGKQLVPNQSEQRVIALMRKMESEGSSLSEIAHHLTNAKIKTKSGLGYWGCSTVRGILRRKICEISQEN